MTDGPLVVSEITRLPDYSHYQLCGKQVSNLDKGTVTTARGLLTELVELYSDSDIDPRLHRIAASAEASLDHLEANYGDANHDKTPV